MKGVWWPTFQCFVCEENVLRATTEALDVLTCSMAFYVFSGRAADFPDLNSIQPNVVREKTHRLTQLTPTSGIDMFLIRIYDEQDFKVCRKELTARSRCIDSTVLRSLNLETLVTAALKQRGIAKRGAHTL